MPKTKITHKQYNCIGCNSCVTIAPQNWEMDKKKGKAKLINGKKKRNIYSGELFDCDIEPNIKAANACPMNCISVEKEKNN